MSKRKKQKGRSPAVAEPAAPATPTVAQPRVKSQRTAPAPRSTRPLIFGPATYKWLGIGFALIVVGFFFMMGGRGDDPTVFDEKVIYSFWRITFAPIVILSGLGVTVYAIFKK